MISLYVKQHNTTGLKYFGVTRKKDPYVYKGSGTYWNQHLLLHGNDVDTIKVWTFNNDAEASAFALEYSKQNNIVESSDWANLIYEDAIGNPGGYSHTNEAKLKISKARFGKSLSEEHKHKIKLHHARAGGGGKPHLGKKFSEETKAKMSIAHTGKSLSEQHKRAISLTRTGIKRGPYKKKINT